MLSRHYIGPFLLLTVLAGRAQAYHVSSGLTPPCHEELTGSAFWNSLAGLPVLKLAPPAGKTWRGVADRLIGLTGIHPDEIEEEQRFLLYSLILGARIVDTGGYSFTDFENKRRLQTDRRAEAQYAHALRAEDDDYEEGNAAAIEGLRSLILDLVAEGDDLLAGPADEQVIGVEIYLDFYGRVKTPVFAPYFLAGKALHAVQDSFSHTIRSDADGLRKIVTVMNFIDAVSPGYDENRDGLAHSDNMDDCYSEDVLELTHAARLASTEFLLAVHHRYAGRDPAAVERFLDEWISLKPGCSPANNCCSNQRWLKIARKQPSGDYLADAMGCSSPGRPGCGLLPLLMLYLLIRNQTKPRTKPGDGGRPCPDFL